MNPKELTLEERMLVHNPEDILYFEVIKGMKLEELRNFDIYTPTFLNHYAHEQKKWINEERYLIGKKLHKNRKDVTDVELIDDMEKYHNAERFRTYYCLKFPMMVGRIT